MNPLLGGGLACLLLLVLMLVVAERKARAANERQAHRTHRRELETCTPEELTEWREKSEKVHSDEVAAMKRGVETWAAKEKMRSGEWRTAHPDSEKERDGG